MSCSHRCLETEKHIAYLDRFCPSTRKRLYGENTIASYYRACVIFENLCLRPSLSKREAGVFKTSTLGTVFNAKDLTLKHWYVTLLQEPLHFRNTT